MRRRCVRSSVRSAACADRQPGGVHRRGQSRAGTRYRPGGERGRTWRDRRRGGQRLGASVVHYSTDYVFDGTKAGAYQEQDPTAPLGAYARSKLEGEQCPAERTTSNHLILRTSWVVGAHGNNFARTMLRLAAERPELRVVNDQWGAPTSAALIADLTAHLVARLQRRPRIGLPLWSVPPGRSGRDQLVRVRAPRHRPGAGRRQAAQGRDPRTCIRSPPRPTRPWPSGRTTRAWTPGCFRDTFGLELPHWQLGLNHILQQIL